MIKVSVNPNSYRTILELYRAAAIAAGKKIDGRIRYDCCKIKCAQNIQDEIFRYYDYAGYTEADVSMAWVCYGPQVENELKDNEVVLEEGAVSYECT